MADEPKKKAAPKKEGKPDAVASEKAAPKASGPEEAKPAKKHAAAPTAAPAGPAAPAGETPKPGEAGAPGAPAAAPAVSAPTAAELLADDLAGKKIVKAKGSKNITAGIANILATFNNTLVSITDMHGNIIGWSSAGRVGFKGSRKSTATPRSRWRRTPRARRCPTA